MGLRAMLTIKKLQYSASIVFSMILLGFVSLSAQDEAQTEDLSNATQASPQTDEIKKSKYADKDIQELYNKGLEHLNHSNSDSALAYLQEIMSRAFDEVDSKMSLAQAYIKLGQYEKAIITLEKAQEIDSQRAGVYRLKGQALADLDKNEQAIAAYEKAVQLDSLHVFSLNTLAVLYIEEGQYEEAAPLLKKAIDIRPDVAYFYNNLGVAFEGMTKFQRAIESFQTTLSIDPTHRKARQNLARVREKSENMSNNL
jgi:tetratricopeptide (TPR) repeat protein